MTTRWETRLRCNNPKFIDILTVGAADSSGAIARVPMRDGYFDSTRKNAALIAAAPELLDAIERCYKMLTSTPNAKDALFTAENILRDAMIVAKGARHET